MSSSKLFCSFLIMCMAYLAAATGKRHMHNVGFNQEIDSDWYDAHATFYGDIGGGETTYGACGYGDVFKHGYGLETTVLSTALYNDGLTCGACLESKCVNDPQWCYPNAGTIKVTARDICPRNSAGGWCHPPRKHFDLSKQSGEVGVYYGRNGDNLPSPRKVIDFVKTEVPFNFIRIPDDSVEVLDALATCNLGVTIGVPNEKVRTLALSQQAADDWFQQHIAAYLNSVVFRYVIVGNDDAISNREVGGYVLKAIQNLQQSIVNAGLLYIHVTATVGSSVLGASFPPSQGQFAPGVAQLMADLTSYLYSIGSPLLINIFPIFELAADPTRFTLELALFQPTDPIVDGDFYYFNLFDVMVDAFAVAMVKVVHRGDVRVVVSETGWPTSGVEPYSSLGNARSYISRLRNHVVQDGKTPRGIYLEVYLFELFDENLNPPTWRDFGLIKDIPH